MSKVTITVDISPDKIEITSPMPASLTLTALIHAAGTLLPSSAFETRVTMEQATKDAVDFLKGHDASAAEEAVFNLGSNHSTSRGLLN